MITTATNPIELLDKMLDSGDDIWETAVNIGMNDEEEMTVRRWRQGDVTLRIEGAYGDGIIEKFATALNVNSSTLKQRRTMSNFYTSDTRYLFENSVGYSHYREAMRCGNIDDAIDSLNYASENDMPVWKFSEYINKRLGKERRNSDSIEGWVLGYDSLGDEYNVKIRVDRAGLDYLKEVYIVNIRAK